MAEQRHPQAIRSFPERPTRPIRLRLHRRCLWPSLFETFGYIMSVGAIWYVGAAVARFAEAGR
jgi:hypothetical protein